MEQIWESYDRSINAVRTFTLEQRLRVLNHYKVKQRYVNKLLEALATETNMDVISKKVTTSFFYKLQNAISHRKLQFAKCLAKKRPPLPCGLVRINPTGAALLIQVLVAILSQFLGPLPTTHCPSSSLMVGTWSGRTRRTWRKHNNMQQQRWQWSTNFPSSLPLPALPTARA